MNAPTYIEETWWEVTLSTGLILTLPAPLRTTSEPIPPHDVLYHPLTPVSSYSVITGKSYALNPKDVVHIKTTTIKADPERYQRAVLKAAASATSLVFGPTPASPSDNPENPRGRSTGEPTKRRTH